VASALLLFWVVRGLAAGVDLRLVDAAKRRDPSAVRTLLREGVDVNVPEPDGTTALAWAAHRDDREVAALLIRAGADPKVANHYGVTPLSLACTNRSAAMVEMLLKAGADPNAAFSNGETPLLTAARTGDAGVVKLLLLYGAEVKAAEQRRQQTALMWAVVGGHADAVKLLVEYGADVRAASTKGFTPLMFAARNGDVEIARTLVAAGAQVDQAGDGGITALLVASGSLGPTSGGYEQTGAFLLEQGADPNVKALPYTALHAAIVTRKPELVKALLAAGANANARAAGGGGNDVIRIPKGATPFWLAAREVDVNLMRVLSAAGADVAQAPDDGSTALMTAAGVGQVEGPRVNAAFASPYRSRWDETKALDAVRLLLELGGDVNAVNKTRGWSALHGAAHMGADRMVQWLVERGATIDVRDKNGQTAWSIASEGARDQLTRIPHRTTADLLLKLGADSSSSK
jgi:ankyrin repeat protein